MKVSALIEKLKKFPQDKEVQIAFFDWEYSDVEHKDIDLIFYDAKGKNTVLLVEANATNETYKNANSWIATK